MKKLLTILAITACLGVNAQPSENVPANIDLSPKKPCKPDTVVLWVRYNVSDTIPVNIAYYDGKRIKATPGYSITFGDLSNTWQGARNVRQFIYDDKLFPFTKKIFSIVPRK